MLRALKLRNFKKHRSTDINLQAGLNVVRGPNAQGKTSILKGILFALFGSQGAGAKDHLMTWGARSMSVSLDVDLPRHGTVRITRTGTSARAETLKGDEVIQVLASGHAPVTAFVEDALGVDFKTFRMMSCSPQGEVASLLTMGAAALQRRIEEIAGADVVEAVLALIATDVASAEGYIAGIGDIPDIEALKVNREAFKAAISEQEVSLARHQDSRLAQQVKMDDLNQQIQQVSVLVARADQCMKHKEAVAASIRRDEQTLSRASAEMAKIPADINKQAADGAAGVDKAGRWVQVLTTLSQQATACQKARNKDVQVLATKEAALSEMDAIVGTLAQCRDARQQAEQRQNELSRHVQTVRQQLTEARNAVRDAVCPTCKREFEAGAMEVAQARLVALQAQHNTAVADASEQGIRCADLLKQEKALEAKHNPALYSEVLVLRSRIDASAQQIRGLLDQAGGCKDIEGLDARLRESRAGYDALLGTHKELQKLLALYVSVSSEADATKSALKNKEAEHATLASELSRIDADLSGLPDQPTLVEDLETARRHTAQADQGITETQSALSSNRAMLSNMTKTIEDGEAAKQRMEATERRLAVIKELQSYLRKNRVRLGAEIWGSLLAYASSVIGLVTEGRLASVSKETNGGFSVLEGDRSVPVDELSGAQRAIVGVALRLAISHTFYGVAGVLLLDEISADCDESNAAALAGMLLSLGSQVVMVTHRSGDSAQAGHVVNLAA